MPRAIEVKYMDSALEDINRIVYKVLLLEKETNNDILRTEDRKIFKNEVTKHIDSRLDETNTVHEAVQRFMQGTRVRRLNLASNNNVREKYRTTYDIKIERAEECYSNSNITIVHVRQIKLYKIPTM